jgi:Kinase/pyrophosphorylase
MPDRPLASYDRTVFFVSDGTGITAETLGHSVLTQFEDLRYRPQRIPFIDSADKAREAGARINEARERDGKRPIVFSTLVNPAVSAMLKASAQAFFVEMFETFVEPLERELDLKSTHTIGRSHNISVNSEDYKNRIEAINFALAHDDGQSAKGLAAADVILVGVSRSGKTPTSLYLAMQYGVKAANYCPAPAQEQGLRPVDRAGTADRGAQRAAAQQPLRLDRELPLRGGRGRAHDEARKHPLAVVDHQVDRGDRGDDHAGDPPGTPRVLSRRLRRGAGAGAFVQTGTRPPLPRR